MVEFMKSLEQRMFLKWRHAYLNYKMMKKQLKIMGAFVESEGHPESLTWLKLLFQRTLDSEISKMLDFYRHRALALRQAVDDLEKREKQIMLSILNQRDVSSRVKMYLLTEYQGKWHDVATKLVTLLEYVSLNMQALRKTVKKQHKVVGALKPDADPALQATLTIQHPHEPKQYEQGSFLSPQDVLALGNMEQAAELKHVKYIIQQRLAEVGASVRQFERTPSISQRERLSRSHSTLDSPPGRPSMSQPRSSIDSHFEAHLVRAGSSTGATSVAGEEDIDSAAIVARTRMLLAQPALRERATPVRHRKGGTAASLPGHSPAPRTSGSLDEDLPVAAGFDVEQDAEQEKLVQCAPLSSLGLPVIQTVPFASMRARPLFPPAIAESIRRAADELKRNAKLISGTPNNLGFAAAIFEPAPLQSRGTSLGVTVQLVTTFLYMANYNLVIPTVDNFMQHLKVPSTTGGLMIGCADGSAIAIALLYSAWTNRSYRQPMLAAAVLCCVGNLLVTLAYDTGGLPLLLVGRLVNGAGNARMISRRYMADFFAKEDRDRVSMLFVAASAFGMAFGPFITWPLSLVLPLADDSKKLLGLSVNIITVGGWLMVFMWVAFYIFAHFAFEEPLDADVREGGAAAAPLDAPTYFADCTPAQDSAATGAGKAHHRRHSTIADSVKESLGSSRLLHGPPVRSLTDNSVIIYEDARHGSGVTEPLLNGAFQQEPAHGRPPSRRSSAEAAAAPHSTSTEQCVFVSTAAAPTAGLSPGPSEGAAAAAGIPERHAPEAQSPASQQDGTLCSATEAEASADAISFLSRPLLPASSSGALSAMWARVVGVVHSSHFLPTVTCSVMLFLLKLLQQTTVSAVPVFTGDFYGWRESDVSLFMTAMSLAMFFVTIAATLGNGLVGRRVMIGASLFFCGCGCILMMSAGEHHISLVRYLTSLSTILAFTNILEGVTMSVMGDVIHPAMAAGFLNAGLLSTQAGSIGRLFGNTSITVFGSWADTTIMLGNEMYFALAVCVALCAVLFVASYSRMDRMS